MGIMKYPIRNLLHDSLSIGTAVALTWALVEIHLVGYAYLKENIPWIRHAELAIVVIAVLSGIERFIRDLRRK